MNRRAGRELQQSGAGIAEKTDGALTAGLDEPRERLVAVFSIDTIQQGLELLS